MTTTTLKIPFQHHADARQFTLSHAWETATTWYERSHQRRQLAALGREQLRDIGISYEEAMSEAAKPFWQV